MVKTKSIAKKKKPKPKRNCRRNIRHIIKNVDLSELTKLTVKKEKERKNRVNKRSVIVRETITICVIYSFESIFPV